MNLEEKARKKGITNISYFRIENSEYFENLSNDQLNNYIKRFNEHKEIVEELISKKESEENNRKMKFLIKDSE
jgi:predicted PolB exonuclease-like 3'-5' exonuclease